MLVVSARNLAPTARLACHFDEVGPTTLTPTLTPSLTLTPTLTPTLTLPLTPTPTRHEVGSSAATLLTASAVSCAAPAASPQTSPPRCE